MRELDLVRRIREHAAAAYRNRSVVKGIGDDCAIVRPAQENDLVFTTDFVLEGRHFSLATHSAQEVGYKALARSLSDLAAMGSKPVFCLVSLAVPERLGSRWIDGFYKGLLSLGTRYKITVAGGDLSSFGSVVVDVMCCGQVQRNKAILRSGAKPGDFVYVTGKLGGAAHSKWTTRVEPRIDEGIRLSRHVSAGIDISDGLSIDLHRLCLESGVAAELDSALIPVASGATLDEALHGGEDYELLVTARPNARVPKALVTRIGTIKRGKPGAVTMDGRALPAGGYDHFARVRRVRI